MSLWPKVRGYSHSRAVACVLWLSLSVFLSFPAWAGPHPYTKADRELARKMLQDVAADVKAHYYDPTFHGVDWDATVRQAAANIDKAESLNAAVSEIAAALDTLNDSHTFFIIPPRSYEHDYGFQMQMFGEHCYVTSVKPGADAAKKGLKAGDEILAVDGHPVSRNSMWRLSYIFNVLQPQPGLQLTLPAPAGGQRQLEVMAKFVPSTVVRYFLRGGANQQARDEDKEEHLSRARYFDKSDDLLVVKIPEFDFSAREVDNIIGRMRKHKGVILDLRGNPGGSVNTLARLLGGMFENDLTICRRNERDKSKTISVTGRHHDAFTGRFAVLIDSESASASELFARVIQLERRGLIIGDRSSGSVMESLHYHHELALDASVYYGASVTDADLIMSDGKSLEHTGVEPDITLLPSAKDIATGRDPVLSKAATLVGGQLTPEDAGAAFPREEN